MLLLWHRSTAQAGSATPTAHPVGAGPALFPFSPLGQLITLSHSQAVASAVRLRLTASAHPFLLVWGQGQRGSCLLSRQGWPSRHRRAQGRGARRDRACQLAPGHRRLAPPSPSSRPRGAPGAGVSWALGLTYFSLTHISCGRHPSRAARGPALIAAEGGNEVGRDNVLPFPNPSAIPKPLCLSQTSPQVWIQTKSQPLTNSIQRSSVARF